MRKVTSISLLVLLLLNLFGFYAAFFVNQNAIKNGMVELMEKKQASHPFLVLSKHDFESITWITKGEEFRLNGKLYDVAQIEFIKEGVKLFLEEDSLETNLIADFVSILNTQSDKEQSNSPIKLLLEHFLKEFTVERTSTVVDFHVVSAITTMYERAFLFTSFIANQQSPPPDLV